MFQNITTAYDLSDATWEIVIMLTVSFLMGWFFRYLWSMRGVDISALYTTHTIPDNSRAQHSIHEPLVRTSPQHTTQPIPKVQSMPAAHPASILTARPEKFARFREDDLKIVEGIGPKIEELLKANGVTTWQSLANTSPATLKTILVSGGERFQMHDPSSWPDQVALALENRWDELAEFQTLMAGGRVR